MSTALKVVLIVLGVLVLLGAIAAFVMFGPPNYAEKLAEPEFCASCHVMDPMYASYVNSAHGTVTESCNDCHLPNDGFIRHWTADAFVGMRDLVKFNLNIIPEFIRVHPRSVRWIDENCRRCHDDVITEIHPPAGKQCWDCHREVQHDIAGRQDRSMRQPVREDRK